MTRLFRFVPLSITVLALLGACAGPERSRPAGATLEELGELLTGGQPIQAVVVEGSVPLEKDSFAWAEPEGLLAPAATDPEPQEPEQNPYIRFGERIIVRNSASGVFITKPYTMPSSKAERLVALMDALRPFEFRPRPQPDSTGLLPPLEPGILEYQTLKDWDQEFYSKLVSPADGTPPDQAKAVTLSDVFVVTASYALLEQFEEFLDLFAAGGVPQIELEAKIIEVVETDQLDVGFNSNLAFGDANFIQGIDFQFPNVANTAEALLDLGAVQSSLAFDAMLEAVRTWDNVQIDSRPKTVVRAGGVAYIESTTEFPFSEIKSISDTGGFSAAVVYKKVGVQLYISPRIIGTKMLALDVHLIGSQQIGSQATFSTEDFFIEVPVIASRTAKTVVYLEPGQTLVIGGLTTQRERELVNKVPILGDIPLIGALFRSTFKRMEKQHVLFAISPRILQHSDFETEF